MYTIKIDPETADTLVGTIIKDILMSDAEDGMLEEELIKSLEKTLDFFSVSHDFDIFMELLSSERAKYEDK
jgi:hypothetical protein